MSEEERKALALQLLGDAPDAKQRAEMYAGVTAGKTREEIAFLILGRATTPAENKGDPVDAMLHTEPGVLRSLTRPLAGLASIQK